MASRSSLSLASKRGDSAASTGCRKRSAPPSSWLDWCWTVNSSIQTRIDCADFRTVGWTERRRPSTSVLPSCRAPNAPVVSGVMGLTITRCWSSTATSQPARNRPPLRVAPPSTPFAQGSGRSVISSVPRARGASSRASGWAGSITRASPSRSCSTGTAPSGASACSKRVTAMRVGWPATVTALRSLRRCGNSGFSPSTRGSAVSATVLTRSRSKALLSVLKLKLPLA